MIRSIAFGLAAAFGLATSAHAVSNVLKTRHDTVQATQGQRVNETVTNKSRKPTLKSPSGKTAKARKGKSAAQAKATAVKGQGKGVAGKKGAGGPSNHVAPSQTKVIVQ